MQMRLPNQEFRKFVPKLREKGFYKHQGRKQISWPEYNLSQINEIKDVLIFIRESVNKVKSVSTKGRVGRPLTDAKVLAKAILFCELIQLPERQAQGWLELLGPFLGIYEKLDDRVIGESYGRPEIAFILKQVFDNTKTSDGKLAGDGTGLETSRKQNYELTKNSKEGQYMVSVVDSREVVQAFEISGVQECQIMKRLIGEVEGKTLCLDAGFVDRKLTSMISELGMKPFIFPKKNVDLNGRTAWKMMYLELFFETQKWLKEYHQRSHCESFHSSFKRVCGIVTKLRFCCKLTQVTARIILHNRRRLSYFNKLTGSVN
ncbi:MAG: transposase [Nanoarchaeota archaeon]|nr:transposase [Nanoarchaeota archaeon]